MSKILLFAVALAVVYGLYLAFKWITAGHLMDSLAAVFVVIVLLMAFKLFSDARGADSSE